MSKNPQKSRLWRICGPLLLYWVIGFVAQLVAEVAVMLPNMSEIMDYSALSQAETNEQMTEIFWNGVMKIYELMQQYSVQITAFVGVCTIPLTLTLFLRDRKVDEFRAAVRAKAGEASKQENGENEQANEQANEQEKSAGVLHYLELVLMGAAFCIGMNCLVLMINMAFTSEGYEAVSSAYYSASIPVQFICLGIIIPITEELMFRGVLFRRFREQGNFLNAAVWSALIFGLTHGNVVQLIYTGTLGVLLAYVYEKFRSLKAPVLLHITVNLLSLAVTDTNVLTWLMSAPIRIAAAVIICAFIGSSMFVLIRQMQNGAETADRKKPDDRITPDMFR